MRREAEGARVGRGRPVQHLPDDARPGGDPPGLRRPDHPAVHVGRCVAVAVAAAVALAGCGGGNSTSAAPPPSTAATTTVDKCKGSNDPRVVRRKLAKLNEEVAHIRVLAAPIQERTLNGTPALSAAVDKFLVDVRDRDLPVHVRSRLIDHVAADVSPVCEQCFQALEANRPIAGGAKLACG